MFLNTLHRRLSRRMETISPPPCCASHTAQSSEPLVGIEILEIRESLIKLLVIQARSSETLD